MSKNRLHLAVDILAYAAMACLAATGLIMYYRLPPGSGSAAQLGLTRHEWGRVHFYIAIVLLSLVALHVILHWKWVTNTFGALLSSRAPKAAGAGVVGAAVLAAIGVATAALLAAPWLVGIGTGRGGEGRGQGEGGGKGYRGGRLPCDDCAEPSATTPASPDAAPKAEGREPSDGGSHIQGSMTLAEVAAEAGISYERIVAELKLPANTSPVEQLGRLRKQHGFTMADVRAAVARLKKAAK